MFSINSEQPSETQTLREQAAQTPREQTPRDLPLSAPERRLLRALVWGEPLAQAAQRMELSPGEARQMLSRLQKRAGVASFRALIARAVAHRWAG